MKTLAPFLLIVIGPLVGCQTPTQEQTASTKPNILFIMADDLGYGDLGAYNPDSKVPTPTFDKLAAGGIRFTDAYCPVAVCTPTRYALMTGQYPWRSWKKNGVMRNYEPSMIAEETLTLPEMLQQAGYTTAGFGKWHLGTTFPTLDGEKPVGFGQFYAEENGANLDFSKPVSDGPLDHGFDTWYGFSCASECWIFEDRHVTAATLHDYYTIESAPGYASLQHVTLTEYLPLVTQKSIAYLQKQAENKQKPFFLYYAPYVPHIPLAVDSSFIGKTEAGLYGDYVHELDFFVGKLLDELARLGMAENTLILMASDNGSQYEVASHKFDMNAIGNRQTDISELDTTEAHRPNFPLRGTKWQIYEGGVRTPLIAHWPDHFPEGAASNQLIGLMDVLKTLASVVKSPIPEGQALDSYDLLPAFYGEAVADAARESIAVRAGGQVYGLRRGRWKYIEGETPELYDLSEDVGETQNLVGEHPEIAVSMQAALQELLDVPAAKSLK